MKTLSDEKQELLLREKFSLDIPLESNKYIYYRKEDVKEFIKETDKQLYDFGLDIIALIKINNYGKDDLIAKMARLIRAHKTKLDKLAGKDLI